MIGMVSLILGSWWLLEPGEVDVVVVGAMVVVGVGGFRMVSLLGSC